MCIWVTRPAHQAGAWATGLEAAGAQIEVEPLLAIGPPADSHAAQAALTTAETADVVIATSANAVREAWRLRPGFAPIGSLYAVGAATGEAFERAAGRPMAVAETGDTSEALLALPGLREPDGRSVVLLSGEGGRGALAETLAARGATLTKAALYRRIPAAISSDRLMSLLARSDAVVVTSGEALMHLCALVCAADSPELVAAMADAQLVLPSLRVVQLWPDDLLERAPIVPTRMTLAAVVAALAQVRTSGRQ